MSWSLNPWRELRGLPRDSWYPAPPDRRGEDMGYYAMAFGIGFSLGPWAGSAVLEAASGRVLWIGCFCAAAVSAALLARVDQPGRASSPVDALDEDAAPTDASV